MISLNRNLRDHRIVYLCYLFGRQLDNAVDISCLGLENVDLNFEPTNFLDRIFWRFDNTEKHNCTRSLLLDGYTKFFNNQNLVIDNFEIYDNSSNDNISNFNNRLRPRYQNSFVEIVTESSFASPGYMLTEKTMHSFYACNFPIILAGVGAVAHLRNMGFDMFDDIIDHSYDQQNNPIDRITEAIDYNERLLTDGDYVKNLWTKNRSRFEHNIHTANNITKYYEQRARESWNQLKWQ